MAFREYRIGCWMFGFALSLSMFVTIILPGLDISSMSSTKIALEKQLTYGWETGFNYYDPFLQGKDKPVKVVLTKDPMTGKAIDKTDAFVFPAGTHFPSGLTHDGILGDDVQKASEELGKIGQADEAQGGVFLVRSTADDVPYIEFATATKGWTADATLKAADEKLLAGSGKTMFVREGCWWCHTLLPEQTQDVMCEPPCHVCLVQTGQMEPFRSVTDKEHNDGHEHTAGEEPVGGIDTLCTTINDRHPHVQGPRHYHHKGNVQVDWPDMVGILTAGSNTGPEQCQSQAQAHIIQQAIPDAEFLGPQLGITQSRGDVHHGSSKSHGNPAENHGMHMDLTHMTELQRIQAMEQVRKSELGSIKRPKTCSDNEPGNGRYAKENRRSTLRDIIFF